MVVIVGLPAGFVPVKVYNNFYNDRGNIRRDHRGPRVSAVYMLVNIDDPSKFYMGQSSNLLQRINNYLNAAFRAGRRNSNMPIIRALDKYGPEAFMLVVLEYVDVVDLGPREIYWISLLKPYYNVLPGGVGSPGMPHTEATKALLRAQRLGTKSSEATKALISEATTGANNPFYGKTHTLESRFAIAVTKSAGSVYVYDCFWTLQLVVVSTKSLGRLIHSNSSTIQTYIISGDVFRGGWYLRSEPLFEGDLPLIPDVGSPEGLSTLANIEAAKHIRKAVFVFDANTREFKRRYDGVLECAVGINSSHTTVTKHMTVNGVIGKNIVSNHRVLP